MSYLWPPDEGPGVNNTLLYLLVVEAGLCAVIACLIWMDVAGV